jgi:hypothetical protein
MDVGNLSGQIASVSRKNRVKLLARLQAEQADRDKERADREKDLFQLQVEQADRDKKRAKREARQTKWQVVQLIAVLAAVATVIASVFALRQGYENLHEQQQAVASQDQESRYSSVYQLYLDLDKTIADHPRLNSCFQNVRCNAKPALTPQEMQQAIALASYVVDFYQYLYDQLQNLGYVPDSGLFTLRKGASPGVDNENWITWSETIVDGFKESTLVCNSLKQWAPAYEQLFVHAVAVTHVCRGLTDPGPGS